MNPQIYAFQVRTRQLMEEIGFQDSDLTLYYDGESLRYVFDFSAIDRLDLSRFMNGMEKLSEVNAGVSVSLCSISSVPAVPIISDDGYVPILHQASVHVIISKDYSPPRGSDLTQVELDEIKDEIWCKRNPQACMNREIQRWLREINEFDEEYVYDE